MAEGQEFEVNFTNTLILALLSTAIFGASCGLRSVQQAAEKAGRLRAGKAGSTPATPPAGAGGGDVVVAATAADPTPAATPHSSDADATSGKPSPASVAPAPAGRGLTFGFTGASLAIGGKPILTDITGHVPACAVTAFMGPSGCGKSSLMSVLRGTPPPGSTVGGVITINGTPAPNLAALRAGFVPQEDVVDR